MTMDTSRLLYFFISYFALTLVTFTISQPDLLDNTCSDNGNYTINSTYESNLRRLLSSFATAAETDYGFYNVSAGQNADKVYGVALCRGDLTPEMCRNCINASSHKLPEVCPNQKQAIGWYDECMLRYSNESIIGTVSNSETATFMWNIVNVSDVVQFNRVLGDLLAKLRTQAALGGSLRKFASGEANFTSFQTVYAFVQCTPDLSQLQCSNCLDDAIGRIPEYFDGKQGARVLGASCNFRYETYLFYKSTVSPPPAPPSTPPANLSPPSPSNSSYIKGKESKTSRTIIIIVVPSVISLILIVSICIFLRLKKKHREKGGSVDGDINAVESMQFDIGTIRMATDNFSDTNKLGEGGFGSVYKGKLSNGQYIVVKRLSMDSGQGDHEFKNEVLLVAKLQHRNLVRLQGFCIEGNEKLLVYEFVPNTSLEHFIFGHFIFDPIKRAQLDWESRYKIIAGIARGLLYLHEDSPLRIIHRDLKASNILLDGEMLPKIADFGMARMFVVDQTQGNTSKIVGTYGYMAPEYVMHGHFSVKSDVFSFGVLVLEIVSGQRNSCFEDGQNVEDLVSYAWKNWREGTPQNLIDPTLTGSSSEIIRCIHIGLLCVQENVAARPSINSVVLMLSSYSLSLPGLSQPPIFRHSGTAPEIDDQSLSRSAHSSDKEVSMTGLDPR